MKLLMILSLLSFALRTQAQDSCLFDRPLIIGASVSAGYKANPGGPGMLMAKKLNLNAKGLILARNGATSMSMLRNHKIPNPAPSIVIGLDLLFWDAGKGTCGEEFRLNLARFIELYKENGIPVILGKIPVGAQFPTGHAAIGSRPCARIINEFLENICRIDKNCLVYDSKECWGGLKPGDDPRAMFVDSLHTSVLGNQLCAREFVKNKTYLRLKCAE